METDKKIQKKQPAKPRRSAAPKAGTPLSRGTGRRKRSIARVWLRRGKGTVMVNGKTVDTYFDTDFNKSQAALPLKVVDGSRFDL